VKNGNVGNDVDVVIRTKKFYFRAKINLLKYLIEALVPLIKQIKQAIERYVNQSYYFSHSGPSRSGWFRLPGAA
jgi:hypothetical protein